MQAKIARRINKYTAASDRVARSFIVQPFRRISNHSILVYMCCMRVRRRSLTTSCATSQQMYRIINASAYQMPMPSIQGTTTSSQRRKNSRGWIINNVSARFATTPQQLLNCETASASASKLLNVVALKITFTKRLCHDETAAS